MDRLVLPLLEATAEDGQLVGGKAAKLAALARAGFPVPSGVCVTTRAFAVARAALPAAVGGSGAQPVDEIGVPEQVARQLADALVRAGLVDRPLAVRSSATAEDLTGASFAGQYDTILGVLGEEAVLAALGDCWRSFFIAHATAARAAAGVAGGDEAMAVLIQPVVEAECAGVAFSVDPVRLCRDTIVVDAVWGLGAGAVDGSVECDSYRVHRGTFDADERHVVEKSSEVVLGPSGGTTIRAVDAPRRRAAILPDPWVKRVAQVALAADQLFGQPQDVEWAVAGGQLWVLQSRPITTLPPEMATAPPFPVEWPSPDHARSHWERDPGFGPAPRLPLDADAAGSHSESFRESSLVKGEDRYRVGEFFNGRRYFRMVPSPLREGDRRVRREAFRHLVARVTGEGRSMWDHWAPEVVVVTDRLARTDPETLDAPALAAYFEDAFGAHLRHYVVHWTQGILDMVSMNADVLPEVVRRATRLAGDEAQAMALRLSDGEETVFTRLIAGLYEIALAARGRPAVEALVADPPPNVIDRLAGLPDAAPLLARLGPFLEEHGDRCGSGFGSGVSLMRPTWRDDPTLVLRMAAPYLDPAAEDPGAARARALAERDALLDQLCAACAPELAAELRRVVAWSRRQRTSLEDHNHYIDQMAWGQLRRAVLAAGKKLAQRGAIEDAEDVFWLHREELVLALRSAEPTWWHETVASRRAEHAAWAALEAPLHLGVPPAALPPRPAFADAVSAAGEAVDGRGLRGIGASPGVARGRARVVSMDTLLPDVARGDVLVAVNAGPTWTPLFPVLAALVLDQGALLQHAATTAREFGIPAVLQTGNATRRIKDGDWVTVDGVAGTVEID